MDVAAWRRQTRIRLIAERQRIPPDEHERSSAAIRSLLEDLLKQLSPRSLSAYWPFKGEVDLRSLMENLHRKGWTIALPSVVRPRTPLEFRRWTPDTIMDAGVHGIDVPRTNDLVRPDFMILPLVGFDAHNYRLGYGAGYFDITLASMQPCPRTLGVGFELCRMETIYPLPTDVPLDLIVTETGIQGEFGDVDQMRRPEAR
jgi:5-formyltetrahydrofolate cyclo-ligase